MVEHLTGPGPRSLSETSPVPPLLPESFSLSLCSSARMVVEDGDPITPVLGTIDSPCSQFLIFRGERDSDPLGSLLHPSLAGGSGSHRA